MKLMDYIRIVVPVLYLFVGVDVIGKLMIPTSTLLLMVFLYVLMGVLLFQWIKKDWFLILKKFDYYGMLLPIIFVGFFWLNNHFSSNNWTENYTYSLQFNGSDTREISTTIQLEDQAYEDYYFLRTFGSINEIMKNNRIEFQFAKGLLGFTVVKDYVLSKETTIFENNH